MTAATCIVLPVHLGAATHRRVRVAARRCPREHQTIGSVKASSRLPAATSSGTGERSSRQPRAPWPSFRCCPGENDGAGDSRVAVSTSGNPAHGGSDVRAVTAMRMGASQED